MKIRTRLILTYSILSIILLVGFSFTVLFFSIQHRKNDFKTRLTGRAKSAVKMLIDVPQIDSTLLSIIDDNTLSTMNNVSVTIYDSTGALLYNYKDRVKISLPPVSTRNMKLIPEAHLETIRFNHTYLGKNYTVEASGVDLYGYQELNYLVKLIWTLLAAAFLFILIAGIYNAYWSLKPFGRLIREIESFKLVTNKKKLDIYGTDEVAQLSQSFNNLLDQLIKAYEDQKAFVSQVSHELRTPVTALLGQIEITLNKERSTEEYRKVIQSVYEDGLKIAVIINSLLELAESNLAPENIEFTEERIDELLFTIIDDFQKEIPESKISIGFTHTPEDDIQLTTKANKRLLSILFRNLIENALKFSEDKHIEITIEAGEPLIEIGITDKGIGIAPEELDNIFKPMFRGMNVKKQTGHGLGLSIVRQIAELHHASISIDSELNKGTKVVVNLLSLYQQKN